MSVQKRDVERLYLQAILSRGVVSDTVAQLLRKKCFEAVNKAAPELGLRYDPSPKAWGDFVSGLKTSLDKLDLEFSMTQDESTGKIYWALVNLKDDELAQLATDFSPVDIAFFKNVVEQIMYADNESYSISSMAALRETGPKLTKAQGETLLSTFVAKGWLRRSKRGHYSLAVRSTLELLPYLKSTYPDEMLECKRCGKLLTRGVSCTAVDCTVHLHHHCAAVVFRNGSASCPGKDCKIAWPSKDALNPVGEEAPPLDDSSAPRRRARARTRESDEEEEAQMSEDADENPRQARSNGKGKAKANGKGKGKQANRDDDDDDDSDVEMVSEEEEEIVKPEPRRSSRRG